MIAIGADRFRSRRAASPELGGGSGGHMDDVSKRLGLVESAVAEMRVDLRHLATKADLKEEVGRLSTQIASLDGRIPKWLVGTALGSVGLAVTVAKLLFW